MQGDYAQVQSFARKTDPTVKNVNLTELIEDVVALSEQRAKYSGV
ncbi:MAG: Histidine kinase, partial [Thermodesulfobacteriota bacterium]|nr:Histidine kinase [Thermodesulfobacteriota bacterium]